MAVRVVHLSSVHPAIDNRILNKECRSLAQAGYEVVLLAPHDREEVIEGVQIRPLGQWKGRLGRLTVGSVEALRRALAERGDVYHVHDPELLLVAPLLRWRSRAAVIYDMHENVPKALASKTWIPQVLRPAAATLWRRLETLLLRTKMPVVFAERSYAKDYHRLRHTVVVENMVASSLASVEAPKYADFTLVYVGGVTRGRGIGVTLAALESLWEMGETVRFECVGPIYDQSLRAESEAFAKRWGDRVRFHGRRSSAEAMKIAARAHVGLAILQPCPNYIESFPTKMFEYMGLGLPLIASDFPLYRNVVETEGTGICVDPTDSEAVIAAILSLKEDPATVAAMGERGKLAVAERYNWKGEEQKLLRFYESILNTT